MGLDVYSYAVFGLKVSNSQLMTTQQVRGCQQVLGCSHPKTDSKFCPECGKPMFIEKTSKFELGYGSNIELHYSDCCDTDDESTECIIGFQLVEANEYNRMMSIPSASSQMIQELVALLTEHNIQYNEKDLKTYLIQYYSY